MSHQCDAAETLPYTIIWGCQGAKQQVVGADIVVHDLLEDQT